MIIPHNVDTNGKLQPAIILPNGRPIIASDPGDKIAGIYDQLFKQYDLTTSGVSAHNLPSDVVDTGYIWHIQAITLYYGGTVTSKTFALQMIYGANTYNLNVYASLPTNGYQSIDKNFYMIAGYKLNYLITPVETGKLMRITLIGVTMRNVTP